MKFNALLTATVIASLVAPPQLLARQLRVVETPELLLIGGAEPGGHTQRLVVLQLPADDDVRIATVAYEESGITRFSATVSIGVNTIDVEGTAGSDPFRMHWVDLGRGVGVETTFVFGDARFTGFLSDAGPDDVTLEEFARFQDAIADTAGGLVVEQVKRYLQSAAIDSGLAVFAGLATFGAGGDRPGSPIRNYLACVKDSCTDCGGCWQTGDWVECTACPRQPYLERVVVAACYHYSVTLCLRYLLLPI